MSGDTLQNRIDRIQSLKNTQKINKKIELSYRWRIHIRRHFFPPDLGGQNESILVRIPPNP
jgi:hypothetical protein